jgi:NAD-dependent dihydropyrimidine dehydrogenase PreA subunit
MGLAVLDPAICLRGKGEDCQVCVDKCPVPRAISIPYQGGPVIVHDPGCVGCGVCEMYCPTAPKAIVVVPESERAGPKGGAPGSASLDAGASGSYLPMD